MGMFQPSWTYNARRPVYISSKTPAAGGISMAVVAAYYGMLNGDDAMQFLRQSTASQVCLIGPLAKSSDGTAQTGQTIANTDIKIRTNSATTFANKNSGGATEIANGSYYTTFDATDTATVGRFDVSVALASTLVWERSYMVLPGIIYDSFFPAASGDPLPAWGIIDWGTAQASAAGTLVHRSGLTLADDIPNGSTELIYGGTGAGQTRATYDFTGSTDTSNISPNWTTTPDTTSLYATFASAPATTNVAALPAVNTTYLGGTLQTARDIGASVLLSPGTGTGQLSITAGVVSANTTQLAAQTVTAAAGVTFPSSVASPTNITAGTITTVTNVTNAPTAGDFTATMKTSIGTAVAASAVASVTGNIGGNVGGSVGSVVGAVGSVTGNIGGNVLGSVASVTAVNDKTGYSLSAAGVDAIWDEQQSGHTIAGTFGKYLDAAVSGVSTGGVAVQDIVDGILNEPVAAHAVSGSVGANLSDTNGDVNAIRSKTDNLTFTVAGKVDANTQRINGYAISGTEPPFS